MDVRLLVHLERQAGDGIWWAEAPQVPGFSVAADSLVELQGLAKWALADILRENGDDTEPVNVTVELVANEPFTSNPAHRVAPESAGGDVTNTRTGRTRVASPA